MAFLAQQTAIFSCLDSNIRLTFINHQKMAIIILDVANYNNPTITIHLGVKLVNQDLTYRKFFISSPDSR